MDRQLNWPDAGGLIQYKIVPREDVTFGGEEYRRANPGRTVALARSIQEHGLMLPAAVVEAGTTPGTEGMEEIKTRRYITLAGERRFMALGKGSTAPVAVITNWPQFLAWMELDKEIRPLFGEERGVLREHTPADRNRFRNRALTFIGDRRPWTRKAREGIAAYFDADPEELRSYQALVETVEGRRHPERQDLARQVLGRVEAGEMTAMGALARVVREHTRRQYNGKPAPEQRATIAASLVALETAARALDELGEIAPEFPREELAAYGARLAKVRAKITRASRSIRGEAESE